MLETMFWANFVHQFVDMLLIPRSQTRLKRSKIIDFGWSNNIWMLDFESNVFQHHSTNVWKGSMELRPAVLEDDNDKFKPN